LLFVAHAKISRTGLETAFLWNNVAGGLVDAALVLCDQYRLDTVVLSGGVFQNELLLEHTKERSLRSGLRLWTNHAVPPNDAVSASVR
jgi:hydrogenase maturation protein HypF